MDKVRKAKLPPGVQGAVWRQQNGEPTALLNSALSAEEQAAAREALAQRVQELEREEPFLEDGALDALFEKARAIGAAVQLALEEEAAQEEQRRDHRRQMEKEELLLEDGALEALFEKKILGE